MGLISTTDIGPMEFARELRYGIGGAESNVAIGAARLGASVMWIGRLGCDAAGDMIKRRLRAEGVRVRRVGLWSAACGCHETIYKSARSGTAQGGGSPIRSSEQPASPREGIEPQLSRHGWHAAGRPRQPVLLVNLRSGGGAAERGSVVERARGLGIEAVVLTPGHSLAGLAQAAAGSGADALGMAGGDGSLAAVAAVAAAHDLPFVCIPAGTRNHFALDLGVDRHDLPGALDAFCDGVERVIDIADVNGRPFLNNVSLGVYGDAVQRPSYRDAKVRTLLETAHAVLGPSGQAPALTLTDDAGREHRQPAVLLVSNNSYALDQPVARGTRPALDTGQLGVLVLDAPGDPPHPPARAWTVAYLEVAAPATLHAGIDGEAAELSGPLRFTTRPASLRVRISRHHPGASPSAGTLARGQRLSRLPRPAPG